MNKNSNIEKVRSFLMDASRQFEQEGIFLERVKFNRNEKTGDLISLTMNYEDRTTNNSKT